MKQNGETTMKCKKIERPVEFEVEDGTKVLFEKTKTVPGFTHKVILLNSKGEAIFKDWFAQESRGHKVSTKVALFYWDKHIGKTGKIYV